MGSWEAGGQSGQGEGQGEDGFDMGECTKGDVVAMGNGTPHRGYHEGFESRQRRTCADSVF